jgi:YaaC-like Protein
MPRTVEEGVPALHKHNRLRYSFVELKAGDQHVLTSDPWAFLNSHLQTSLFNKRGANKDRIERAIYFASLAEDFYRAAQTIPLPAQGMLYYYGMLDLVKSYLSMRGADLETTIEHHGLTLPQGKKFIVEAKPKMKDRFNVFAHFCEDRGKQIRVVTEFDFKQILSHVPEIHGIYTSLGHISKRKLIPIQIEFQVNSTKEFLFTEIIFEKEQEAKVDTSRFLTGARANYFREGYPRDKKVVYRAIRRKSFSKDNIDRIYKNILAEYANLDVVPILTPQGYKYYADLRPGEIPHLAYSFMAMFYLGSAARYRPLEIRDLLEGKLRPLVSEFVSLAPRQFLYQMVSLITGRECVIPFAAI